MGDTKLLECHPWKTKELTAHFVISLPFVWSGSIWMQWQIIYLSQSWIMPWILSYEVHHALWVFQTNISVRVYEQASRMSWVWLGWNCFYFTVLPAYKIVFSTLMLHAPDWCLAGKGVPPSNPCLLRRLIRFIATHFTLITIWIPGISNDWESQTWHCQGPVAPTGD